MTQQQQSLARLAVDAGERVHSAGNLPLSLDDPQSVWFVEKGAVDLFLTERRDGVEQSAQQHLLRAGAGRLLPGVAPQQRDTTFSLVGKGLPDTVLRRLPLVDLSSIANKELGEQADAWIMDISTMLSQDIRRRPRPSRLLEPGLTETDMRGALSTYRRVIWVSEPPPDAGLFMDLIDPTERKGRAAGDVNMLPLTPLSWLTLAQSTPLSTRSSAELAAENLLAPALADFHDLTFSLERLNRGLAVVDRANLERAREANRRADEEIARQRLFNLYGLLRREGGDIRESALFRALRIIGRHEGIDFKYPDKTDASGSEIGLREILDGSGARAREVRLDPQDKWWVGDSGALLAFTKEEGRPVVLLPGMFGRYREVDPVSGRKTLISAGRAASYRAHAWLFYQPLTAARVTLKELFRLARKGQKTADLLRFTLTGLLGGLVTLLPAIMLGFIVDTVIPTREPGLLYLATLGLAAFALTAALLQVLQGTALMRLEARATSRIEAAIWDRLLRLPAGFLQRYPAGELAMRGMSLQTLRDAMQGVVANAVLSVVFLSPAFILIFFYDAMLGGITAAFALLSLAVTVALGMRQIAPHNRAASALRSLTGQLFQIVKGISKLRVEGAEGSAFAVWASAYREQKDAELELSGWEAHLQAFGAALPLAAGAALLLAVTLADRGVLSVGDFLVVYTVFMVFQTAVTRLGVSFNALASIRPTLEQIMPLLAEPPENSAGGKPVESLGGDILFGRVSFRYEADGPLILDDVSIHARPGEFIAIAGESGSGKSTLFRLALGLEQPSSGAIYYDGRDLKHLDFKQVRRLIGSVPQDVKLHPQDLWDNIVGGDENATLKQVWEATEQATINKEIEAMPMQLLTNVGASAGLTSGGESQRLTIAHAMLRSPRILLLDEATNWLDNENQAKIMHNLERLASTRIVIAHRLSTLRQADRIYVMQSGKVAQQGSFAELMEIEGVFRKLVQRQVA